jgi:glutathione S-transferase
MTDDLPELTLYDFPADPGIPGYPTFSPFVFEVARALALAKLPFRHTRIDIMKLKKLNPVGQLPVLGIGSELVADSTRILRRIEALAPGSLSGGLDGRALAEAWLWEEFADTALYPHVLATRWWDERGWPVVRNGFFGSMPALVRGLVGNMVRKGTIKRLIGRDFLRAGPEAYQQRLDGVLDLLEARAPEQGFWLGARASVADLGLFAHLHQLRMPLTAFRAEEVKQRVRLSAWLDRVDRATS